MILVTSANGNQGSRLVPKLLATGCEVRACVRTEASAERLRAMGTQQVRVGDFADPRVIAQATEGVRSVYYVGPTLHPAERRWGSPQSTRRVRPGSAISSSARSSTRSPPT